MTGTDKIILSLYIAVIAGIALQFAVMSLAAQIAGGLLFFAALITGWLLRRRQPANSLRHSHTLYISHTVWVGGLVLALCLPLAGLAVSFFADPAAIGAMTARFMETYRLSQNDLHAALHAYIMDNFLLMIAAAFTGIGPALAYFTYRFIKGISLAVAGKPVPHPRTWL